MISKKYYIALLHERSVRNIEMLDLLKSDKTEGRSSK
jgi:hypothetical protein